MIVTFPHMGNVFIPMKALLDDMGVESVIPPFSTRATLEMGARYAPEGACLPLKITVGNLMEGRALGADTMVMLGAWGPCRFGYYCQMQQEVLSEAGCPMRAIILEACAEGFRESVRRAARLFGGLAIPRLIRGLRAFTILTLSVDRLERLYRHTKTRELRRGEADRIYRGFRREAFHTRGSARMLSLLHDAESALGRVDTDEAARPLRIGIVGEIYGTIDPFMNLELESRLCAMGVAVERLVTISDWLVEHILKKAFRLPRDLRFAEAAAPYLGMDIGGHTRETIGHTVMHAREGYDGIIQLYPLGCMPEIVAQSILPRVIADMDIPVLTLIYDEHTGEAGYITRLEAFLDLLIQRRASGAGAPGAAASIEECGGTV